MVVTSVSPTTRVLAFARQIGPFRIEARTPPALLGPATQDSPADAFVARLPDERLSNSVSELLLDAKRDGLSYGGTAELWILKPPKNLGQPVFRKLKSDLAASLMSVGASTAIELGDGFDATDAEGTDFHGLEGESGYGGIRGGISTGEKIILRVGFKPTSSVLDVAKKGRHDPCIVPRAIPVLEAMTWLCLADHALWTRSDRL